MNIVQLQRNGGLPIVVTGDMVKVGGEVVGHIVNQLGENVIVFRKETSRTERARIKAEVQKCGYYVANMMHEREWAVRQFDAEQGWEYRNRAMLSRHLALKNIGIGAVAGATIVGSLRACEPSVNNGVKRGIFDNVPELIHDLLKPGQQHVPQSMEHPRTPPKASKQPPAIVEQPKPESAKPIVKQPTPPIASSETQKNQNQPTQNPVPGSSFPDKVVRALNPLDPKFRTGKMVLGSSFAFGGALGAAAKIKDDLPLSDSFMCFTLGSLITNTAMTTTAHVYDHTVQPQLNRVFHQAEKSPHLVPNHFPSTPLQAPAIETDHSNNTKPMGALKFILGSLLAHTAVSGFTVSRERDYDLEPAFELVCSNLLANGLLFGGIHGYNNVVQPVNAALKPKVLEHKSEQLVETHELAKHVKSTPRFKKVDDASKKILL